MVPKAPLAFNLASAHRRHQPEMMADRDGDAGALDRLEHGDGVGLAEREGLFAVDMLGRAGRRDHLGGMGGMRRRQHHRLDGGIGQHLLERAQLDFTVGDEILDRVGLERDAAREFERRAEIACRLHQGLAPPAEADDRGVEHWSSSPQKSRRRRPRRRTIQ